MAIRILVNCLLYKPGKAPGFETFLYSLLRSLAQASPSEWQIYVLIPAGLHRNSVQFPSSFKYIRFPVIGKTSVLLWEFLFVGPSGLYFDVILHPHNFLPLLFFGKNILVLHDLRFTATPDEFTFLQLLYRRLHLLKSARYASAVISISHFTAKQLYRLTGRQSSVIHNALPDCLQKLSPPISQSISSRDFILCIASEDSPSKNLLYALQACSAITGCTNTSFVFIGKWNRKRYLNYSQG